MSGPAIQQCAKATAGETSGARSRNACEARHRYGSAVRKRTRRRLIMDVGRPLVRPGAIRLLTNAITRPSSAISRYRAASRSCGPAPSARSSEQALLIAAADEVPSRSGPPAALSTAVPERCIEDLRHRSVERRHCLPPRRGSRAQPLFLPAEAAQRRNTTARDVRQHHDRVAVCADSAARKILLRQRPQAPGYPQPLRSRALVARRSRSASASGPRRRVPGRAAGCGGISEP